MERKKYIILGIKIEILLLDIKFEADNRSQGTKDYLNEELLTPGNSEYNRSQENKDDLD